MRTHSEVATKWRLTSARCSKTRCRCMLSVNRPAVGALRQRRGCDMQVKEAVPDYVKFVSDIAHSERLSTDFGTLLRNEPLS